MKKIFGIFITCMLISLMVSCNKNNIKNDKLKWDNEHALYAVVNPNFKNEVLDNVDNMFSELSYKKVYIVGKNYDSSETLLLLFILNDNDNLDTFRKEVLKNETIDYVYGSIDLPFDTVDTRYIECEKTKIAIGEKTQIRIKGSKKFHMQQFSYNSFMVKPKKVENTKYKISDFPDINLKKIEKSENGWLTFELKTEDYFNVIKAIDKISRLEIMEKVNFDRSNVFLISPVTWTISDKTIVESTINGNTVTVKGLSKGKVVVEYDGVKIEIVVE